MIEMGLHVKAAKTLMSWTSRPSSAIIDEIAGSSTKPVVLQH
jgi:hypothetical protein